MSSGPVHPSDLNPRLRHDRVEVGLRYGRRTPAARIAIVIMACAGLNTLAGCSGRGAFLSGGTSVGQLKTTVSHLEYENAELKRSMAKLEQENRQIEDRLVKEQLDNGELIARLNDARNLIRDRGEDQSELARSRKNDGGVGPDEGTGARTVPAGRATPRRRKLPVAKIPGQIEPAPGNEGGEPSLSPHPIPDTDADRSSLRLDDNLDHHTYYSGPLRWTRIVARPEDSSARIR